MIGSLDILGKRYAVVLVERAEGDHGECFYDQCRLEVASYQCEDQKRDTLVHEMTHAIDLEMNLNMSERQIRRYATVLLQVLRHNPELVAFLTADAAA